MLEKIYLALQERIIKHTEIRFVDLDYGQYELDTRPGAIFPAVLINFDEPDILGIKAMIDSLIQLLTDLKKKILILLRLLNPRSDLFYSLFEKTKIADFFTHP